MTKHQLSELLDLIDWSKAFARTDSHYIRVRKVKEWVEDEIKEKNLEELNLRQTKKETVQ